MKIEELLARESIRDTMGRYSIAGDEFAAEAYVNCFTEDGVMEFADFPGMGHLLFEGRQAIGEFAASFFAAVQSGKAAIPGRFMRHHLTTSRIDITGEDSARAKTYALFCTGNGVESSGIYSDEFRRVGDQWLIARRHWCVDS